jgi:endonuclease YncB( thermonuclease family)
MSQKIIWIAAFLVMIAATAAKAETMTGKVVAIADGDTITVLIERREVKVRIGGIDAPEKKQPFGQQSKQAMSDCAFGKEVNVQWKKTDRYGRTIGKVVADGVDCGLRQIELGLAWHYKAYQKEQPPEDRITYATAESSARSSLEGLWSDPTQTPPWEFRHAGKRAAAD